MYWPAANGSPVVYSLTKHVDKGGVVKRSHDGLGPESADVPEGSILARKRGRADVQTSKSQSANYSASVHTDGGDNPEWQNEDDIIAAKVSRGGSLFTTITRSTLTVWQTKPTVALTTIIRSELSLQSYGPTVALLMRPDNLIIVLQTKGGYLITYTLSPEPNALVYQAQLPYTGTQKRKNSEDGYNAFRRAGHLHGEAGPGEGDGIAEVNLRFRMVIRIDAGICCALALDNELVVSAQNFAALQMIKWIADSSGSQWSTELISKMPFIHSKSACIVDMVHDRPMNLACWISNDGRAYAVQRRVMSSIADGAASLVSPQGFCFRTPETDHHAAVMSAINARFSLIAVGCANGMIEIYAVKDYTGNIPLSHKLSPPAAANVTGRLTYLGFSPDGYCLFAGFEYGWALWSVYGKPGANSFHADRSLALKRGEVWLSNGVKDAFWIGGGSELALIPRGQNNICILDFARSAATSCFTASNVSRGLLQSSSSVSFFKGHDIPNLTSLPGDVALWQTVQFPRSYLIQHWPLKCAVISADGHYIAIAGHRGLAHYSVVSNRWKTFDDPPAESEFAVRGGMCWWQHYLIAAVEIPGRRQWQIRVYSREKSLGHGKAVYVEELPAPTVLITTSGTDSLLVYTQDNLLLHFVIVPSSSGVKLVQMGQIGFHGIIRAPPRVRSMSWILPEEQVEHGDPSKDVATASVIFLVDGKLVLLQPSVNESGGLRYDMRVIATNVEYYVLTRDYAGVSESALRTESAVPVTAASPITPLGLRLDTTLDHSLRDSLWYFDGDQMHLWTDVLDILSHAPVELGRELPPTVSMQLDFYPLAPLVNKGVLHGVEAELVQRRDVNFSFFRHGARTSLFLPRVLRHHLQEFNPPAALYTSSRYQHLPYFAHALEVLLHDVLDTEVDTPPSLPETALLPGVISFLSSFPCYLDVVVNCTRKTELRSWRTLFANLPPVRELFEQSLAQGKLKTATGFLLVLHTFAHGGIDSPTSPSRRDSEVEPQEFARLLRLAALGGEWELCRELARFLVGIDSSGKTLRITLAAAGLAGRASTGALNGRLRDSISAARLSLVGLVHDAGVASTHRTAPTNAGATHPMDYFTVGEQRTQNRADAHGADDLASPGA